VGQTFVNDRLDAASGTAEPSSPEAPETQIAFDMCRRAVKVIPVVIVVAGVIWGTDGAWSAAYGVAIVLVNLVASALALARAARISPTAIMVAALGGFLVRMTVVGVAVFLVKDADWVNLVALGITVLVTHLGLLFWELRYVSASLAFPGLKPTAQKEVRPS
jgi:hypothetical protein